MATKKIEAQRKSRPYSGPAAKERGSQGVQGPTKTSRINASGR